MNTTITDVEDIRPLGHHEAMDLATTGYERAFTLLESLEPDDWTRSTDCAEWTVKDLVCHVLGEAEAFASMREFAHQFRISSREARATGAEQIDAMNALQVRERAHLEPDELLTR